MQRKGSAACKSSFGRRFTPTMIGAALKRAVLLKRLFRIFSCRE
jgi:hypothetical protein